MKTQDLQVGLKLPGYHTSWFLSVHFTLRYSKSPCFKQGLKLYTLAHWNLFTRSNALSLRNQLMRALRINYNAKVEVFLEQCL
jgi:hypothetical protein